ncbi:Ribosomal RNA small subunit methyltransferase E [Fulvivirga imtechensis AK7]|uniref:Ribosomal RNA small subunit methyltransferase E n=1 Tax=Fulvivirga imtechensis AK7 TaxID=1237149 RepID=L8JYY5_9BACT|nr:16S rRNA (uracil(1498)-N(3))-methyltransferase [Fulvivirga imtechensis]ELR72422.1 Ribosomal RNA small subunit methyltransferase E [Fulvivirga imtechensis AK7]
MSLFYQPEVSNGVLFLDEEESRHCIKVLRYKTGDTIQVQDGRGNIFSVRLTSAHQKKCEFEVIDTEFQQPPPYYIHVGIAPTKNLDRIEWFVEKTVEIGVQEISFISCKNSERKVLKLDRLERKALSAMKQSQHRYMPKLNELRSFNELTTKITETDKYIAHVDFDNPVGLARSAKAGGKYCVLIGPEGDFTSEEVEYALQNGFKKVSLGSSRLRTETAGIVACHTLNLINDA